MSSSKEEREREREKKSLIKICNRSKNYIKLYTADVVYFWLNSLFVCNMITGVGKFSFFLSFFLF